MSGDRSSIDAVRFWLADVNSSAQICQSEATAFLLHHDAMAHALSDAHETIVLTFTAIAGGNREAGERFAATDPTVKSIRAVLGYSTDTDKG